MFQVRRRRRICPEFGVWTHHWPGDPLSSCSSAKLNSVSSGAWREGGALSVAKDREQARLDGFWKTLAPEQLAGIDGVAIDMWDAFENSIRAHVPDVADKIVYDKFHIVKHLSEDVDKVRRQERKQLRCEGDERLTGTKHDWLRNRENFDRADGSEFQALKTPSAKA
jgi:transposase